MDGDRGGPSTAGEAGTCTPQVVRRPMATRCQAGDGAILQLS